MSRKNLVECIMEAKGEPVRGFCIGPSPPSGQYRNIAQSVERPLTAVPGSIPGVPNCHNDFFP